MKTFTNLFNKNVMGAKVLFLSIMLLSSHLTKSQTVVDIILGSEVHTTLATAVDAANLVTALQGEGPFTVFAPTDAAFAALPEGTVASLLEDPSGALTDILLYHVVQARALSTDLSNGQTITTMLGKDVTVTISEGKVYLNGAEVIIANLEADNGVVHVIDAVLLPELETSIPEYGIKELINITLYPNPASDYVNIDFQLKKNQHAVVEIFAITGERVLMNDLGIISTGYNSVSQSLSGLRAGTYIIALTTDNERIVARLQLVK